ncbi:P-loop containing nucleoside triphosphate hydrolase protein [Mycena latifolia]|nr:P-loop containing nucleoside triphosphate hydrolase protein [Mycena latifolia]
MAAPTAASREDRRGATRTVPMTVLVLGFFRTGTASMRTALETLGYKHTYHMQDVLADPREADFWTEAIDAKFEGKGTPFGRAEWDQLLGHCQAVTDVPAILFSEELIATYPDAKVILTLRDPAAWWASYTSSLQTFYRSERLASAGAADPAHFGKVLGFSGRSIELMLGTPAADAQEEASKARLAAHYASVKAMVPKERLLEVEVGEGWGRLCAFLGEEVPQDAFPRTNDAKALRENIDAWAGRILGDA